VTDGETAYSPVRFAPLAVADLRATVAFAEGGPLKIATLSSESTPRAEVAVQHACLCARVAADNKARDVVVLDMRGITPLYDYFVLATGTSRRQIHNMAEEIDAGMAAEGEARLGIEGYESSRWVVQDYGDIVVHLFDAETRGYYGLDDLWADAKPVDWQEELATDDE
jgi:ribosome-associated protein